MMLFASTQNNSDKILFVDTVKETLCPATLYRFSIRYLNASIPANCTVSNPHLPGLTLSIENAAGQVLQSASTGPVAYDYNMEFSPKFHLFPLDFTLPSGVGVLVLKIINEASVYTPCVYDIAIDDIQFSAVGPKDDIVFDDAIGTELTRSVCFQDDKTISMTGVVGVFYTSTSLQWETSNDGGVSWADVPGANTLNYSRSFSVADTFLYRLGAGETSNIANPNCRVVSNVLKIEVNGVPADFNITNNSPVCSGSDLIFNAEGGSSYEWNGPNGFYDNIAYPHIFFSSLADSGMYYVDIITPGGCRATDSTYAKIIGTDVHAGPDTAICKGRTVQLKTSSGVSHSWSPAEGLANVTSDNPLARPDITTLYTVKVTDSVGCSDTAKVLVKIINKQEVKAIVYGPEYICRPQDSASFTNLSVGDIVRWKWAFSNGQTDTLQFPGNQYYNIPDNEDEYIVKLTVTDSAGCSDSAFHIIKVAGNCYIAVPSAFSPNADGLNDYLYPLNAYKATNLTFTVYNRNGQPVFTTKDWAKKWDGTVNGNPQDAGTYVWMLQYEDERHKKISLRGTSLLIR